MIKTAEVRHKEIFYFTLVHFNCDLFKTIPDKPMLTVIGCYQAVRIIYAAVVINHVCYSITR